MWVLRHDIVAIAPTIVLYRLYDKLKVPFRTLERPFQSTECAFRSTERRFRTSEQRIRMYSLAIQVTGFTL